MAQNIELQFLIVFGWDIDGNILNAAVQNPAEIIERSSIQGLIFAQLVNGSTGDMVLINQRIGGVR